MDIDVKNGIDVELERQIISAIDSKLLQHLVWILVFLPCILCTWAFGAHTVHINKKITKNSEKITHILSILLHRYIEFQVQIPRNEGAVKMIKFLTGLNS
jgi:hypothetical protein